MIDRYWVGPTYSVQAEASVRRPGTVRVVTFGNGCFRQGHIDVSIDGLVALVEPYDSVCVGCGACLDIGRTFTHVATLPFSDPGVATVRIIGLVVPGDTLGTIETAMVIHR